MKTFLTRITLLGFVILISFAFQNSENELISKLDGTKWQLSTSDSETQILRFEKVKNLNKNILGYNFRKNNKLKLIQINSADYGNIIGSKRTEGKWKVIDSKTILLTYVLWKKFGTRNSDTMIERKYEIIEFSDEYLLVKLLD